VSIRVHPWLIRLRAKLRQTYAQLDRLQSEYGLEELSSLEDRRRTMRAFRKAQGKLEQKICNAWQKVEQLEKRRAAIPRRVPVQTLRTEEVLKLAPERKHLTNLIKVVAYQAESELVRLVRPHYRRADDEGRTLIQAALASAADLEVTESELRVRIEPQSSPHHTCAIAELCEMLNKKPTLFPGLILTAAFLHPVALRKNRTILHALMTGVLDSNTPTAPPFPFVVVNSSACPRLE
jgi:hypothetical protein